MIEYGDQMEFIVMRQNQGFNGFVIVLNVGSKIGSIGTIAQTLMTNIVETM